MRMAYKTFQAISKCRVVEYFREPLLQLFSIKSLCVVFLTQGLNRATHPFMVRLIWRRMTGIGAMEFCNAWSTPETQWPIQAFASKQKTRFLLNLLFLEQTMLSHSAWLQHVRYFSSKCLSFSEYCAILLENNIFLFCLCGAVSFRSQQEHCLILEAFTKHLVWVLELPLDPALMPTLVLLSLTVITSLPPSLSPLPPLEWKLLEGGAHILSCPASNRCWINVEWINAGMDEKNYLLRNKLVRFLWSLFS